MTIERIPASYQQWVDEHGEPDNYYEPSSQRDTPDDVPATVRLFERITIDLRTPSIPTPILVRGLYGDGCLTVLQSEPGVGKTWVATWWTASLIEAGHDVIYIDEEGGPELIKERLAALRVDPDAVDAHLHYYAFENRTWGEADLIALERLIASLPNARLAILDSLPDFLAVADYDEDRAKDVTRFIKRVCGCFRQAGIAQLVLDHLPKPDPSTTKKQRSRYSRGSGAKLGKADATLLLEAVEEFDDHTSGRLALWKTKDRRGRLDVPWLGKPAAEYDVTVTPGTVDISDHIAPTPERSEWSGPTDCMNKVAAILSRNSGIWYGVNQLDDVLRGEGHGFRKPTISAAAERLLDDPAYLSRQGPRSSIQYCHQPPNSLT